PTAMHLALSTTLALVSPMLAAPLPACPPGQYRDSEGASNCKDCPSLSKCRGDFGRAWAARCDRPLIKSACSDYWSSGSSSDISDVAVSSNSGSAEAGESLQSMNAITRAAGTASNSSAKLAGDASDMTTGVACDCNCENVLPYQIAIAILAIIGPGFLLHKLYKYVRN
ncbi:hypothetical protein BOX15_Mlig004480g5, partial [Macrostomum lignano]